MTSPIHVRLATVNDSRAIATIHIASWRATYRSHLDDTFLNSLSLDRWTQRRKQMLVHSDEREQVLVAEISGEIVGFASIGPTRDADVPENTGELYAIYVDPGHTRTGIGSALIAQAGKLLHEAGFTTAMLWVLRDNPNARAFYERSRWMPDGSEKQDIIGGWTVNEVRYRSH